MRLRDHFTIEALVNNLLASAVGKQRDAQADLGERDRGQVRGLDDLGVQPGHDCPMWMRAQRLGI